MPEVALGVIVVAALALFGRQWYLQKKESQKEKEFPELNSDLTQNFEELNHLVQKSREVLNQAEGEFSQKIDQAIKAEEKTGQDLLEKQKTDLSNLEESFNSFLQELKQKSETNQTEALQNFNSYLEQLKQSAKNSEAANMTGAKERVNVLFENFETKLADFLLQTEQKMMLAVDLELRSARQLIDTYKVQQMNVVDENIVAMLEKTLALVLAKNLNLKDQMDLVYESLEKAKAEKFIV